MSGNPSDHDERPRLDASTLPEELQRLWDTMLRLDPDWDMNDWLIERANEEMKIVEANLGREKMRLEQRIARLEALANRLGREIHLDEGGTRQCNLFDVFNPNPVAEDDYDAGVESWEPHPASAHLGYFPTEIEDDPLLAVCAQAILLHLEEKIGEGEMPVTLETLGLAMLNRGIESDDLVEALEWLLEQGNIIEVGENEFVLG